MIEINYETKYLDSMIDAIKDKYSSDLLSKPVIGILVVQDIIVNYVLNYREYPDEETLSFLIQTVEDTLQDKMYDYAIEKVEDIIRKTFDS